MKLAQFQHLADENLDPEVVIYLRALGWDVLAAADAGTLGKPDAEVARVAASFGRVILTHDRDFGALIARGGHRFPGLVFLRPGHIRPEFTIGTLNILIAQDRDLEPGFVVVAHRRGDEVRIRFRRQ